MAGRRIPGHRTLVCGAQTRVSQLGTGSTGSTQVQQCGFACPSDTAKTCVALPAVGCTSPSFALVLCLAPAVVYTWTPAVCRCLDKEPDGDCFSTFLNRLICGTTVVSSPSWLAKTKPPHKGRMRIALVAALR